MEIIIEHNNYTLQLGETALFWEEVLEQNLCLLKNQM